MVNGFQTEAKETKEELFFLSAFGEESLGLRTGKVRARQSRKADID
jgi:hypothetical protein